MDAPSALVPAPAALQGCVRAFYWHHHDPSGCTGDADALTVVPPGPYTAIVWLLDGRTRLIESACQAVDEELPAQFVSGPRRQRMRSRALQACRSFGIVLHPAALPLLSGVPMAALADRVLPATSVLPETWRPWLAEVAAAPDHAARIAACRQHLLPRWQALAGPASPWEMLAGAAWRRPFQHAAMAAACWTQRHFQRRTQALTGWRATEVERLLRLERALLALRDGPHGAAQVAAAAGYADQAHFSREARALYGAPPAELVRRLRQPTQDGEWLLRL